jgi:phasin family protein
MAAINASAARNSQSEQVNKAAEATQNMAEEATRTTRTVTDEALKAGERAARVSSDIARRSVEAARGTLETGVNTAAESFKRAADQFTQVLGFAGPQSEELARRSSQNIEAVSQASTVLAKGVQEISQEWFSLAQDRLAKNLDGLNRLARCQSVHDFVAVQSDLARDGLEQAIDTSRRVAELSVRLANEAAKTMQAQASANAERARRAA